jgi:hypothetical protein
MSDCHLDPQMRHSRVSPAPPPGYERVWVVPCLRDPTTIRYTASVYYLRFLGDPGDQVISSFWRTVGMLVFLPFHYAPIVVEKWSCPHTGQLQGGVSLLESMVDTLRHLSQRTFGQFGINSMIGLFFSLMRYGCLSSWFVLRD